MSTTPFNQNTLIDLTNINPNKILEFSFNYELLKYVLTALINNQQNLNGEISKLKLALLEQQKNNAKDCAKKLYVITKFARSCRFLPTYRNTSD